MMKRMNDINSKRKKNPELSSKLSKLEVDSTPTFSSETERNEQSLGPIRHSSNLFIIQFYEVASLQGRLSYFLMSIYIVNPTLYKGWLQGIELHPYLFVNMIYGYTFVLFSRITFMTMPLYQRIFWSFLGSMMFNYSSMITFNYVARNWGGNSDNPRIITATILSVLYGRVYAGALLSYLEFVDTKIFSLVRRLYDTRF